MTIAPTSQEIKMSDHDFIVSKTDLKGKITYCNELFAYFSAYDEIDIIEKPHSFIRHPDMPRAVYRFMWENLKKEQEFFGIIKNLSKNGAYYWTFANVTPTFDKNNHVIGYYSVHRKPSQYSIDILSPVYQKMIAEEKKYSNSQQAMDASITILNDAIEHYGVSYNEFIYTNSQ